MGAVRESCPGNVQSCAGSAKKLGVLVASNALFAAITPLIYRCKEHRIIHKHVLNSVGECHGNPGNHKHNVSNA